MSLLVIYELASSEASVLQVSRDSDPKIPHQLVLVPDTTIARKRKRKSSQTQKSTIRRPDIRPNLN